MNKEEDISKILFAEILTIDQLIRAKAAKALPKGMDLSHFTLLNHLAHSSEERSPAQLAKTFHLTRGAITNRLQKLEWSGFVHIRPDWDDARKKLVSISPAGRQARDDALRALTPTLSGGVGEVGVERVNQVLPVLRDLRAALSDEGKGPL